jgi:1-aminocyclopropane-1-carboxylate deaminase/D-cysteine desulfhydrase-like pyridoxal-dependent ACC family enzyme
MALGMALLELPWRATGVLLAATPAYYQQQQRDLVAAFCSEHGLDSPTVQQSTDDRLRWLPRLAPRKFGRVLPGEVAACRAVAQRHGILLDPIWSLAAWEQTCRLASGGAALGRGSDAAPGAAGTLEERLRPGEELVVMLHTGGALGLCGLAQRFPEQF